MGPHEPRKGFFTDTSICIGCKACEVACKEWNGIPEDGLDLLNQSYDNTGALGASTWRHVAFVEQTSDRIEQARESGRKLVSLGMPSVRSATSRLAGGGAATATLTRPGLRRRSGRPGPTDAAVPDVRWLMASDVCKHCTHAACLDVCPTGALFRTEFGTVVVQDDVCNGCGYCVAACPFGVIERRRGDEGHEDRSPTASASRAPGDGSHKNPPSTRRHGEVKNVGIAQKCTLCYDRLGAGPDPRVRPGVPDDLDQVRRPRRDARHGAGPGRAAARAGFSEARLYGVDENDGVGGTGSTFLLLDEPEVYGLPPDPRVTTADLPDMFRKAGYAGLTMLAMAAASFVGRRK